MPDNINVEPVPDDEIYALKRGLPDAVVDALKQSIENGRWYASSGHASKRRAYAHINALRDKTIQLSDQKLTARVSQMEDEKWKVTFRVIPKGKE